MFFYIYANTPEARDCKYSTGKKYPAAGHVVTGTLKIISDSRKIVSKGSALSYMLLAVLRCGLSDPALSIRVRTFHAPIFKGITFVFFQCFRPLKGIPADRS